MTGRPPDGIPGRPWARSRWLGLLGTLLVHAVFLYPAFRGSHAILVPDKPDAGREQPLILVALADQSPGRARFTVASADPAPIPAVLANASVPGDASAAVPGDDPGAQARLLALYTAQVQAQISRAWRRPRSPVNEPPGAAADPEAVFRCQVIVRQDAEGRIQEIRLPDCNGSPAWRHSLAMAIVSAAPLPPPADPAVPGETLTLEFVGLPYKPGAPPDEYEPPPHDPL